MSSTMGRIQYIDAMRGFTMVLVVYGHVLSFNIPLSDQYFSFGNLFTLFMMPLFFFVSGFLFFRTSHGCNWRSTAAILKRKAKIQLLPTAVFWGLFVLIFGLDVKDALLDNKAGYWFTVMLFEYFVIFSAVRLIIGDDGRRFWTTMSVLMVLGLWFVVWAKIEGDVVMARTFDLYNLLSLGKLKYFMYFVFGYVAHAKFDRLQRLMDNKWVNSAAIVLFVIFAIAVCKYSLPIAIFAGFPGIWIVFAMFRKHQAIFAVEWRLGAVMQYVGRRTLDIYLIHYFLVPQHLQAYGQWFVDNPNPMIEFMLVSVITVVIVALCLLVSNVLRLSPLLGAHLFGAKC